MKLGPCLLIIMFIAALVFVFGDNGLKDYYLLKQKLASLQKANSLAEAVNRSLAGTVILLRKDLRYIERVAREELGMVKQGELVYRFIRDKD